MDTYTSYAALIKPSWSPPAWLFGPVWTVLYALIAVSYGTVFYKVYRGEIPAIVALPFALNLVFNLSFTYFQFTLRNNSLAAVDIILVLATLVWMLVAVYPHIKWVALINFPYLSWVTFATVLQLTITYLNS